MDRASIQERLQAIIRSTETLDFPLFASFQRKRELIRETRERIDAQVDQVLADTGLIDCPLAAVRPTLWAEADRAARDAFGDPDGKKILHGFYLQEVMHRYAQSQAAAIQKEWEC